MTEVDILNKTPFIIQGRAWHQGGGGGGLPGQGGQVPEGGVQAKVQLNFLRLGPKFRVDVIDFLYQIHHHILPHYCTSCCQ